MSNWIKVRKRSHKGFTKTKTFGGRSGSRTTTSTKKTLGGSGKNSTTISSSFGADGRSYRTVTINSANNGYRRTRTCTSSRKKTRGRQHQGSPIGILITILIVIFVATYNYFAG